ncbi:MAG: hypothetical protein QG602_3803 [Verrucomicrobiota bacterium]|nr:hypothetical protein [Verrucomicrobiota bacterium]
MGSFYERIGQVESVTVWREAYELDPTNAEGRLGLARSAIRFGDRQTARGVLADFRPDDAHRVEYHRLRAGLALLERDLATQEEHLAALMQLSPDEPRVRLNLAALRIAGADPAKQAAARATLLELARGSAVRIRAVVELLSDVARRWPQPAPARSAALQELAEALTPARGPLLEFPGQVDHIDRLVTYAMTQPSPSPEDVVSLTAWMSANGNAQAALLWIDSLPATLVRSVIVRTAATDLAGRLRDWPRMQTLLREGAWGPVPVEAVEQAFRAHRLADAASRSGLASAWSAAITTAQGSPPALRMLLRLSEIWQWPAERRQVLVATARSMPREAWAWRQLISDSLGRRDSDQVWQVYQDWRRAMPGEPLVRTEAAIMGFLLGRRPVPDTTETSGYQQQQPGQSGPVVAHALALWSAGRVPEAAAALDRLNNSEFAEPRYALARALILSEAGRSAESEALFARIDAELLLSEERALVTTARTRNRGAAR